MGRLLTTNSSKASPSGLRLGAPTTAACSPNSNCAPVSTKTFRPFAAELIALAHRLVRPHVSRERRVAHRILAAPRSALGYSLSPREDERGREFPETFRPLNPRNNGNIQHPTSNIQHRMPKSSKVRMCF